MTLPAALRRPFLLRPTVAVSLALGLAVGWRLASPPETGDAALPPSEQLRRAVVEAEENCRRAAQGQEGHDPAGGPLFSVRELSRALEDTLLEAHAYGELPALRREARWLGGLRGDSDLGPRTWEDVRFLLGCVHWYLGAALQAAGELPRRTHSHAVEAYDQARLREYRGLDFGDLLGQWD